MIRHDRESDHVDPEATGQGYPGTAAGFQVIERSFEIDDQADTDLIEDLNKFGELPDQIVTI